MKRFTWLIVPTMLLIALIVSAGGTNYSYLPVVQRPLPTATTMPTATPTPIVIINPTPTPTVTPNPQGECTICSYNAYNCSHFSTQEQAQACFIHCLIKVGYDVHDLDRDGDGRACEHLPRPEWELQIP